MLLTYTLSLILSNWNSKARGKITCLCSTYSAAPSPLSQLVSLETRLTSACAKPHILNSDKINRQNIPFPRTKSPEVVHELVQEQAGQTA